jgi:hypothetical protein
MNEFQAEIEATEERCGRSILCRYCHSYHECDEDGTPQGMCQAEREHKRIVRAPMYNATLELPPSLWDEMRAADVRTLETLALFVERAAEQAEADGHRFDAACDWLVRWVPIVRELRGAK